MSGILHSRHHGTTRIKPTIVPPPEAEQIGAICKPTFRPNSSNDILKEYADVFQGIDWFPGDSTI